MDKQINKRKQLISPEDREKAQALLREVEALRPEIEKIVNQAQGAKNLSLKSLKEFFEIKANFAEKSWTRFQKQVAEFDKAFPNMRNYKSLKALRTASPVTKKKAKKLGNRARQRPNWMPL